MARMGQLRSLLRPNSWQGRRNPVLPTEQVVRFSQKPSSIATTRTSCHFYPSHPTKYASVQIRSKACARRQYSTQNNGNAREPLQSGFRLGDYFLAFSFALTFAFGYLYVTDTRSSIHRYVTVPILRIVWDDAEDAHKVSIDTLKSLYKLGINPRERGRGDADGDLAVDVFGHRLLNPIGISAGLDKHGDVPSPLLELGPAVVEIGGITPLPQEGNPRPRLFRIPSQKALINRFGLNSLGADQVAAQLRHRVREYSYSVGLGAGEDGERAVLDGATGVPPGSLTAGKLLAVQIAKNKTTPEQDYDAVKRDYVYCAEKLAKFADIIVVNVSSPNTPGLRSLQRVEPLQNILTGVVGATKAVDRKTKPAVMVKVSPDEDSEEQIAGICQAVYRSGVDGVIVGNTTRERPEPLPAGYVLPENESQTLQEQGGYSGPQMFERTLALVKRYRSTLDRTSGQGPPKTLFATGGITNGNQASQIIAAGSSIAMVYTTLVYNGIGAITTMKQEMRDAKKASTPERPSKG
ncbi:Dihydroorotate dehydrogenase (quinone), mitochondrial [Arachnomyces sp. PD_36]|nr:Dihydroorotate dehydrogenase (quinone), mitochondrial [Arachnomyces sp. PD_36]